jgi:hypothetical protein
MALLPAQPQPAPFSLPLPVRLRLRRQPPALPLLGPRALPFGLLRIPDDGKNSCGILTQPPVTRLLGQANGCRWPPASHSVPRAPPGPIRRALYYRFVHTLSSLGNRPEMLGPAGPESEGFSVRPSRHYTVAKRQLSSTMPMCEDPARILAMVLIAPVVFKRPLQCVNIG